MKFELFVKSQCFRLGAYDTGARGYIFKCDRKKTSSLISKETY